VKGALSLGIVLLCTEPYSGKSLEDGLTRLASILLNSEFQLRAVHDPEPLIEGHEYLRTTSALKHHYYPFVGYSR
jgi:hypothetical protein